MFQPRLVKYLISFSLLLLFFFFVIYNFVINRKKVKLLIPNEFFADEELVPRFARQNKKGLAFSNFTSNEVAVQKISNEDKFDISVLSDYAAVQMIQKGYIQKIDWSRIKYKKEEIFSPQIYRLIKDYNKQISTDPEFDFLDYSVPYFWGYVGLFYNTTGDNAEELKKDIENLGWGIFQTKEKYPKMAMYDSSRDGFMVALKHLGYTMNPLLDTDKNQKQNQPAISAAMDFLKTSIQNNPEMRFVTDEIFDAMADGTFDLINAYSGDALNIIKGQDGKVNQNLKFAKPKSGTNFFIDGLQIPKTANLDNAYDFINFILDFENAKDNADEIGYISPLKLVHKKQLMDTFDLADKSLNLRLLEAQIDKFFETGKVSDIQIKPKYENLFEILTAQKGDKDELFLHEDNMKKEIDRLWISFRGSN